MERDIVKDYEDSFEVNRICVTVAAMSSIPLNMLAMYLILCKSPKYMHIYKFLLLNISVWAFLTDMLLEIVVLPLPVLQVLAIYSKGLASNLSPTTGFVFLVATQFAVYEYLVALLFAFFYRYHVLRDDNSCFGKKLDKKIWYLIIGAAMVIPPCTVALTLCFSYLRLKECKKVVLKTHPDLEPFFDRVPIFCFDRTVIVSVCILMCFWAVVWSFFVIWCVIGVIRQFRVHKSTMSNFNYRLHVQLMKALAVQTVAPLTLYAIPLFVCAFSVVVKLNIINDAFKMGELALALHSTINSAAVILLITAYRNAVINVIKKLRKSPATVS